MKNKTLQKLTSLYQMYKLDAAILVILAIVFAAGLAIGAYVGDDYGYDRGMEEFSSRPEYSIQTFSIGMNTTTYNQTYYQLAGRDLRSTNWVIDLEPRDDYWMINIVIIAKSEDWPRFFLRIERSESLWMMNSTIELLSITTLLWSGDSTYTHNFYDGSTGGISCNKRAIVYFLGYGNYQDTDAILSNAVSIEGRR